MSGKETPSSNDDGLMENNDPTDEIPLTGDRRQRELFEAYLNSDELKSFVSKLMKLTFENIRRIIEKDVLSEGVNAFYGALDNVKPEYERLLDEHNVSKRFLENLDTPTTFKNLLPAFVAELKEGIADTIAFMDNSKQSDRVLHDRLKIFLGKIGASVEGVGEIADNQLDVLFGKIGKILELLGWHPFDLSTEYITVIENILFSNDCDVNNTEKF